MGYDAKILADSISQAGHRLTTFEVTFPRIVLAEVNTHKMISKNSASSRAIPVEKRIAAVEADLFVPEAFGKNKPGMQHSEELGGEEEFLARQHWSDAAQDAIRGAKKLSGIGVHKQLANRLLEPFSWHTAILSGTDWDNFEHLRVHPAAQGEFSKAARMMMEMKRDSTPTFVEPGTWHLPHVPEVYYGAERNKVEPGEWLNWAKVSAARCGRVSFMRQNMRGPDAKIALGKDIARADAFINDGHMSPLEHQARPMTPWELDAFLQYEALFATPQGKRHMRVSPGFLTMANGGLIPGVEVLSSPKPVYYCGNLNGWVQLRKHVPGEADALGYRAAQENQ